MVVAALGEVEPIARWGEAKSAGHYCSSVISVFRRVKCAMEPENPHYDGSKLSITGKLSSIRTTPAVARFSISAFAEEVEGSSRCDG